MTTTYEFNADRYDARTGSNTERLMTVTEDGAVVRVKIEAPSPVSLNLPFVVLSDEVLPVAVFDAVIRPALAGYRVARRVQ